MSMRSFFIAGYGFSTEDVTEFDILVFMHKHMETLDKMSYTSLEDAMKTFALLDLNDFKNACIKKSQSDLKCEYGNCVIELLEEDEDIYHPLIYILCGGKDLDYNTLMERVAEIMSMETRIQLTYQPGQPDECIGLPCIIFEKQLPWMYSEYEKTLTVDEIEDILSQYAEELNADTDVEDKEVEYYG